MNTSAIPTVLLIPCIPDFSWGPKWVRRRSICFSRGVYAAKVYLDDGSSHISVTNIGIRPTVSETKSVSVESYILDFNENLYGRTVRVEFYKHLRDERKFSDFEELSRQIRRDAEETRRYFEST